MKKLEPDFEGFTRTIMQRNFKYVGWCEDLDFMGVAIKYNIMVPVEGGYDPEKHFDPEGVAEKGDAWFELNYDLVPE